jgi:hypothetical protein
MQHKAKCREHFLPICVFLNSLNNDIVESNSVDSNGANTSVGNPTLKLAKLISGNKTG